MARLSVLLHYARRSDSNRARLTATRAGELMEALMALALVIVMGNLMLRSGFGPASARLASAHQLWTVVTILLLFLPLGSPSSIPLSSLAMLPLGLWKKRSFLVLSCWLGNRSLAGLVFALASLPWALRLPQPAASFLTALLCYSLAIITATALSLGIRHLKPWDFTAGRRERRVKIRRWPLFDKEFRRFNKLLDPWFALVFTFLLAITQASGRWVTGPAAAICAFIAATLFLPLFLVPFGLDSSAERARQKLLPMSTARLLLRKHAAATVLFLLSGLPLGAALIIYGGRQIAAVYLEMLLLALSGLLTSGALLVHNSTLVRIYFSPGTFAGNQLPVPHFVLGCISLGASLGPYLFFSRLSSGSRRDLSVEVTILAFSAVYLFAISHLDRKQPTSAQQ